MRIDLEALKGALNTRMFGRNILSFEALPSTNLVAKELAKEGKLENGTLIHCDRQTEGRGRRGKRWLDDSENNLAVSLYLYGGLEAQASPRYTFATAAALCLAMQKFGVPAKIKWPNDVICEEKKLSGILLEGVHDASGRFAIVVGIGVNLNAQAFPKELRDIATSMRCVSGREIDPNALLAEFLNRAEPLFDRCEQTETFEMFLNGLYRDLSDTLGKQVSIARVNDQLYGTVESFDALGRIQLRLADGTVVPIDAGDVSLRRVT